MQQACMPELRTYVACLTTHHDSTRASFGVKPYPILLRNGQKMTKRRPRMTCARGRQIRLGLQLCATLYATTACNLLYAAQRQ